MSVEAAILKSVEYLGSVEAMRSMAANPYWPKWNSPWWHMALLFEIGHADRIPKEAAEKMLAEVKRTHLPVFFQEDIPDDAEADQQAPCPCALGNIYQILSATGLDVDAALPWAREWFLEYQMQDGGLNCDEHAYEVDEENASSLVATLAALEAILVTRKPLTPEEEEFLDLGAQCLLNRELRLGSASDHNEDERDDEDDWLKPSFPRFYFYDVLRGLNFILNWAEVRNQKLSETAISLVVKHLESQNPEGHIRIGRQAFDGVTTRMRTDHWAGKHRNPASRFMLLDQVSKIGEISPALTSHWLKAKAQIQSLKARGLLT